MTRRVMSPPNGHNWLVRGLEEGRGSLLLTFCRRILLVDVRAAYPFDGIEAAAAVLLLELLRGARRDDVVLALAGLHQLRDAVAHHDQHVVIRLQLRLVAERTVTADQDRLVIDRRQHLLVRKDQPVERAAGVAVDEREAAREAVTH